jgi:fibro-slime domain-containing protein/RHS repeat-associated protein
MESLHGLTNPLTTELQPQVLVQPDLFTVDTHKQQQVSLFSVDELLIKETIKTANEWRITAERHPLDTTPNAFGEGVENSWLNSVNAPNATLSSDILLFDKLFPQPLTQAPTSITQFPVQLVFLGKDLAVSQIQDFINRPDRLEQFKIAFGQDLDRDTLERVLQDWQGQGSKLPDIEILSPQTLGKADGGFDAVNNKIYLSSNLIERGNLSEIVPVIIEEIGHYLDTKIHPNSDAAGDEGEIFSKLVRGVDISAAEYVTLIREDDSTTIILNHHPVRIEQSVTTAYAIKAEKTVSFNGNSDLDGNPLDLSDDALVYGGTGFSLKGNSILPVKYDASNNPLRDSQGKLVLVDKAITVSAGYLQANVSGNASNKYAGLNPPQIVAAEIVTVPLFTDLKQQELNLKIAIGTPTTTFDIGTNPINNLTDWVQKFPAAGTATVPKVVRVTGGGLNIPININLSNYVIIVDSGDINVNGTSNLSNVTLVANNGNINLNSVQSDNLSVLASGTINHKSSTRFGGNTLLANGTGNITFNGATKGITTTDRLRVVSAGGITFNGARSTRGSFVSQGDFISNGSADIYGTVSSKQNIIFNGALNFTYANIHDYSDNNSPVILASLVNDSGLSNSDKITNDERISGTISDANQIVEFKAGFDSQPLANFTNILSYLNNGSFSFTKAQLANIYGGTIPDDSHTLNLIATDKYGNRSSVYPYTFTLDTITQIPTLNLAAASDTGVVGDYRTKSPLVTLTGQTEANARVFLSGNSTPVMADSLGNYTFTNVALSAGTNSFTITATDIAGNQNTYSHSIYRTSPPMAVNLATPQVLENSAENTVVGALTTIDPDGVDSYTYSLVDNANGRFKLVGDKIQVANGSLLDFEVNTQNQIQVRTTDSEGDSYLQNIAIAVVNVNESPNNLLVLPTVILENTQPSQAAGSIVVGNLTTIDPDAGDSFSYTLVTGSGDSDNSKFVIAGDKLVIKQSPDYETQASYTIRLNTTDAGGLSYERQVTIDVADVNEAPIAVNITNTTIAENVVSGTVVGLLSAIDPDANDTQTFSLVAGGGDTNNSVFNISSNQLRFQVSPDFETKSNYSLRVRTTDAGGLSVEKVLTVNITNINEAPTQLKLDTNSAIENSAIGTLIGKFTTTDPDLGDSHTYTLVTGNGSGDNPKFTIVSSELRLNISPDFETQSVYYLRVQTTDAGGLTWEQELTVGVTDVNESSATTLIEGTSFNKHLDIPITIPTTGGKLSFKLDPLRFDGTDPNGINDALEVILVDAQGKSLVTPFQTGRDAFFNWTEGENIVTGDDASYDSTTGIVTLNLTGVTPGSANLIFRLLNNDTDTTTTVTLSDLTLSPLSSSPFTLYPLPFTPSSRTPVSPTFFNSATDVSASIGADYHRTSFNAGTKELDVNVALKNQGSYGLNGTLLVVVKNISDPSVRVKNADGFTPEGLPYYTFTASNGKLDPTQVTSEQTLVFKNPNGVQFSYDLTVLAEINAAPVIKSQPELEVIGGKQYQYQVQAEDLNGDSLSYKLLSAPSGMAIDPSTGLVSWNTSAGAVGNYQLAVEVSDGRGGIAQQNYNLAVITPPPNRPPVFTSNPLVDANISSEYKYQATAKDLDGDLLTFSLVTKPTGMIIEASTGVIKWTPNGQQFGNNDITVRVDDGKGAVANQVYKIAVGNAVGNNTAPIITSTPITEFGILGTTNGAATANLQTIVRDFRMSGTTGGHPDFQRFLGSVTGMVSSTLGSDGKPVFIKPNGVGATSAATFAQWYNDVADVNQRVDVPLTLTETTPGSGIWQYQNSNFFPIDNLGYGNQGYGHNFSFTVETHTNFTYKGGEVFNFTGDDDVWVFIDNKLVIDLGGTHSALSASVALDTLGLTKGKTYAFDFFSAERYTNQSNLRLQTSIDFGSEYFYQVKAEDVETASLKYELVQAPTGMQIDPSGLISWRPKLSQQTTYPIVVKVTDAQGGVATQSFDLKVVPSNPGEIRGTVYRDANENATKNIDEIGLQGRTVYIDENLDGQRNLDEVSTTTDLNGNYVFKNLPSGAYKIEVENQSNWKVTGGTGAVILGSGQTLNNINVGLLEIIDPNLIGNKISGTVYFDDGTPREQLVYFNDFEGNAPNVSAWSNSRISTTPIGNRRFLGQYGGTAESLSNRQTSLSLTNLGLHERVTVGFDLYVIASWDGNLDALNGPGPDRWKLQVNGGQTLLDTTFLNRNLFYPPANAQSYPDNYFFTNTINNLPSTGAIETSTLGYRFNGGSHTDSVYHLEYTFDHKDANLILNFIGGTDQLIADESWGIDNVKISISLPKKGITGEQIYLDNNKNGFLDNGEISTLTDANGKYGFNLTPGDYTVAQVLPTGLINTKPTSGSYNVTVRNGQSIGGLDFANLIDSTTPQTPPQFLSNPLLTANIERKYRYQAVARDDNFDILTYDLVVKPDGMVIDSKTGVVTWLPTASQLGKTDAVIRVSDGKGGVDLQAFSIDVTTPNLAPGFINEIPGFTSYTTAPAAVKVAAGDTYRFQFKGLDPDSDPINYRIKSFNSSASSNVNTLGVSIDANTGLLTWNTAGQALGFYSATVGVIDNKGAENIQTFTLELTNSITPAANLPPVIASTPRNQTSVGQTYFYQITATDPNSDPLTYSLINPPAGMSINNQGLLTWTPTAAQLGQSAIQIQVSDGRGGITSQQFGLDVVSSGSIVNHSPEITSLPAFTTNLGKTYSYQLTGADSDNDTLIWSLDSAPTGMVIDSTTGILKWNPTSSQLGTHTIAVRLTDAYGLYVGQEYTLKVNGVNTPPQIQSSPNTIGGLNSPYKYQVKAVDLEGDVLKYSLGRRPTGMVVDNNGLITWTPSSTQLGTQTIDVLVTDAQGAVSTQTYNLVVGSNPINQAPTITSTPKFTADISTKYQYQIVATDPENSRITYALTTAPTGMVIDANTGLITWDNPTLGNTNIQITATDINGAVAVQGYTLTGKQNHAPVINSTPPNRVTIGNTYRYDVKATDSDNDALTYSLDNSAKTAGVSIDNFGRITWKPTSTNIGIQPVTVTVTDTNGAAVTQTYNLEVQADNIAPTINLVRGTNIADIGETISFQVQATDNVGIKSKQLLIDNQAITLDSNGVGTYKVTTAGIVTATAIVTDVNGNTSTTSTTTNIIDPTDIEAPNIKLDLSGIVDGIITGRTDIKGTVTDTNLDYYTLEVARWGTDNWQEVFRGTGNVTNGTLGKFDPSLLENDSYRVRLTAYDTGGRGSQVEDQIDVTGDLKLGNFRLSFTDLTIPVTGIPITLTRTYDSLTSGTRDDFGYGWRMEFRDTDLRTSLKKDEYYEQLDYRTVGFNFGTRIYITLPGGRREGFTFEPKQVQGDLGGITGGRLYYPSFVSDKGVTSTLTVPGAEIKANTDKYSTNAGEFSGNPNGVLLYKDGKLFNLAGRPYVPQDDGFGNRYILTTKDGTKYEINATTGDLETVTDTNGNTLTYSDTEIKSSTGVKVTFERDNQGRITSVTDPLGQKVVYAYDAKGDLIGVTDRDNNTTQFVYNATRSHYLDKIVDPLGREAVKTEYDEQGRLKKTANSSGNGVEFVYDPNNSIEVVKDALGNPTTYEYDTRGNVVRAVDAMGGTTLMEYDDENRVTKSTDANNLVTKYTYDSRGNLTSRSETYCGCAGVVPGSTTYTYNSLGQQTSITLPTGATVFQDYDSRGNLLALRDGKGSTILSYTYDPNGNVLSETSDGTTSTYKYDSRGNVIETKDADGTVTLTEYDANNRLSKMIEADGSVSTFTYDKEGRQTKADYGNGLFVDYTYTATSPDWTVIEGPTIGRIERKFTADGKLGGWVTPEGEITFTYDAAGRLWKETQPNGQTTEYIYDAAGRVTQVKDLSTGASTSKVYNTGGQVLSETDAFGRTTTFTYDKNGKVASTTNALGQTYSYVYAGSSTTIIDPLGRKTTSTNNDYYLPTSTTYNNGAKTSVEYLYTNNLQEAKDYPTKVVGIDGKVRTYGYDAQGNLTTTTDLAGKTYTYGYGSNGVSDITSPTGAKINYEYDAQGNLTKLSYGSQVTKQYTYDGDGNVLSVTSASGEKVTNAYDTQGNVTTQTVTNGAGTTTGTTTSTYDASGNVATLTNGVGTTGYLYDSDGYVSQITSANGSIISYERDGEGRILKQTEKANATAVGLVTKYSYDVYGKLLTVTDSRDRTTTMTYDVVNRLATKTLPNGVKTSYGYDDLDRITSIVYAKADGTVLASETYTRNLGGEPSKLVREDGGYTLYEYDAAVRLSKETSYSAAGVAVKSIAYSYDLDGKRTRKVSNLGTQDYAYNANGQLATAGVNGYSYDADGRLIQVTKSGNTVTLNHDAYDHLTQVTSNGVTTSYRYDAEGNRIGEVSTNGAKNYLVAPNLGNGLASTDLVTDGSGNVVSDYVYGGSSIIARLDANGDPLYYLTDSMGSVIGLVDGAGNIQSRIVYDGFGNVESGDDGSSLGGDLRFQGQWLESESGLYYMRARDYDSETGLFLSRDAVDVQAQGVEAFNPYQFANGNPLVFSDPTGLFSMAELNASLEIQDSLRKVEAYFANQTKNYLIDKAKGVAGDLAMSVIKNLLPSQIGSITSGFDIAATEAGSRFESFIKKAFCDIFDGAGLLNNMWFESPIAARDFGSRKAGQPLANGINCNPSWTQEDLARESVSARSGFSFPRGVAAFPDYIYKAGPLVNTRRSNTKSLLIGDFKISVKTLDDEYIRGLNSGYQQWQAIYQHARYQNGWQFVPITFFTTLYDGGRTRETYLRRLEIEATRKGVYMSIISLI